MTTHEPASGPSVADIVEQSAREAAHRRQLPVATAANIILTPVSALAGIGVAMSALFALFCDCGQNHVLQLAGVSLPTLVLVGAARAASRWESALRAPPVS